MMQIITRLNEEMNSLVKVELYPIGVIPVPAKKIQGTAFFPGGCGLYLECTDQEQSAFPFGGAMILGHNFDSENGFNESRNRGKERLTVGTWGPLLKLLKHAGVSPKECFFTNAFMGLCVGDDNLNYEGRDDGRFERRACDFSNGRSKFSVPDSS